MRIETIGNATLYLGDCIESMRTMPDASVHTCVTSPPYFGLRDYGHDGQIGLEQTPDEYVEKLVEVFREVRRVLRDDGTVWLNLGDSYAGSWGNAGGHNRGNGTQREITVGSVVKDQAERNGDFVPPAANGYAELGIKKKDLIGIPWRVAFALQADGWYLRQDIIWHKPNPMPESVRDRCTKAHEYVFLLSKSERYFFDSEAIKEPADPANHRDSRGIRRTPDGQSDHSGFKNGRHYETRNKRDVWSIPVKPYKGAHFATFPPDLIRPCILAGCHPKGRRCDCDEVIASPTGSGPIEDPTMQTGRAGMNRTRRDDEGTRPITRREQRHEAIEMKASPHRQEMERECGPAFAHYIRTDRSGARPLPNDIRKKYMEAGWITEAPPCTHPIEEAGTVLDPFGGSGTTALVALEEGRNAVLCELNPDYIALAHKRLEGLQLRIE